MRALRNFKPDRCCHLISRIANRAFYLTDEERTRFVERLWRVAKFSGIEVLAYCFMSNHFHLLVHLPEAPELSDEELFDRIAALYSGDRLAEIRKEWEMYARLNDEAGRKGSAKKGLSVDEEKSQKVRQREFERFAQSLPERVPRLLEKGSNKVAFDLLRLLADGPRRPAELRAALGISSVNFFTARYLTPLAKAAYIAVVDTENLHSPQRKYRLVAKGRRLVS